VRDEREKMDVVFHYEKMTKLKRADYINFT
jgi:hypothetical protein